MSNDKKPKGSPVGHPNPLDELDTAAPKPSGPYARIFPPNALVWSEATRLAANKNIRVEDLALCCAQDPVIVLELLKTANALYFSGGRPPITTATTAVIRLGSETVIQTLQSLSERPPYEDPDVRRLFELHRNRGKRSAILARMLAEIASKTLLEDCHTAGLFMFMGDLLAVAHLGSTYVKLHANNSPSGLLYKLAQEQKFDVEKMGLEYLKRQGIPDSVLFAIDREGKTKSQDRAIMKPICFASAELVDAFDANKWEKLAPGKTLPPKSSLRLLQLSEGQYLKLYEKASEYLFNEKMAQERISIDDLTTITAPATVSEDFFIVTGADTLPEPTEDPFGGSSLQNDFDQLFQEEPNDLVIAPTVRSSGLISGRTPSPGKSAAELADKFAISSGPSTKTTPRQASPKPVIPPPPLRTGKGNAFVSKASAQLDDASNSEELLRNILGILTEEGPFEKSAIIVVSKDRRNAIVVAARGPSISNGQTLILEDPLSPLAQCFSKIQSFGNRGSADSPWGSKAFALAPIDADHDTPVALYADCGIEGSLTFEARRIFRVVVDILNQKLPSLPGGIPVEV